jgi:hypothetical protein
LVELLFKRYDPHCSDHEWDEYDENENASKDERDQVYEAVRVVL